MSSFAFLLPLFLPRSFILRKLIHNNEFLKSLLALSLLLVLFAHADRSHDFQWLLTIYSLHGYSFLKIIQIFLRTLKEFHQTRSFIKYLSSIEETILSSMVWSSQSTFWIDLEKKGILTYQQVFPLGSSSLLSPTGTCPTPTNLAGLYAHSPAKRSHVARKLFEQTSLATSSHSTVSGSVLLCVAEDEKMTISFFRLERLVFDSMSI